MSKAPVTTNQTVDMRYGDHRRYSEDNSEWSGKAPRVSAWFGPMPGFGSGGADVKGPEDEHWQVAACRAPAASRLTTGSVKPRLNYKSVSGKTVQITATSGVAKRRLDAFAVRVSDNGLPQKSRRQSFSDLTRVSASTHDANRQAVPPSRNHTLTIVTQGQAHERPALTRLNRALYSRWKVRALSTRSHAPRRLLAKGSSRLVSSLPGSGDTRCRS